MKTLYSWLQWCFLFQMKEGRENVDFFHETKAHQQKINYRKLVRLFYDRKITKDLFHEIGPA